MSTGTRLIDWLLSRTMLSLLWLFTLSFFIWFFGPMVKFGADNTAPLASEIARLIVIIAAILLWAASWLWRRRFTESHTEKSAARETPARSQRTPAKSHRHTRESRAYIRKLVLNAPKGSPMADSLFADLLLDRKRRFVDRIKFKQVGRESRTPQVTFIRWSLRGAYALVVMACLGLLVAWWGGYNQNQSYMAEVESYLAESRFEQQRIRPGNRDVRAVLPALNALAKASIVYDQEQHPWLSGLGMYDESLDQAAEQTYHAQLKALLLPRLLEYLEARLRQGHKGGDLYHNFTTYMMFNKIEHMDIDLIREWFSTQWGKTLQGEGSNRLALENHLDTLLGLSLEPVKLNTALVAQSRQLLLRVPVHQRIYSGIRTQEEFGRPVDLLDVFGESVRQVFNMSKEVQQALIVRYMFTREGYDRLDLSADSPMIADTLKDRWVLSDNKTSRENFSQDDLEAISRRVEALYMADFIAHWNKVLDVLEVDDFNSIQQASEVLSLFTDPVYSPLLSILQVTALNTHMSAQLLQNADQQKVDDETANGNPLERAFEPINKLLRETSKQSAPINAVIQQVEKLNDFIGEILIAPEPGMKAFELARERFESGTGNAMTSLTSYSKRLPEPVKAWMETLAEQSWKVVLSETRRYVNTEWRNQVYTVYQRALAGRYPLNKKTRNEVAMQDFSDFFKPGGIMDGFFKNYINPFVNTRENWLNRVVDKRSLGLSQLALTQVRRAQNIKNLFFHNNPEVPSISFQLKPYLMQKTDVSFQLEVADQRIVYRHGPKFWQDLEWTGGDHNRVRILFQDLQENRRERSYEGPWAFFRLQDSAKLTKTKEPNVFRVVYSVQGKGQSHSIQYLLREKSVNNPFSQDLLGAFKLPESL